MKVRYWFVGVVFLFMVTVCVSPSHAEINLETAVLVALFDDQANPGFDSSPAQNHALELKQVKWVGRRHRGVRTGFIVFDGAGYVDFGADASLGGLGNFTITALIKFDKFGGVDPFQVIAAKGRENAEWQFLVSDSGKLATNLGFRNIGQGRLEGKQKLDTGVWHHVAYTYDGEKRRIYLDGEIDTEGKTEKGRVRADADHVLVGSFVLWQLQWWLTASLEEIAIFNVALNAADMKAISERGLADVLGFLSVSPKDRLASTWANIKIDRR